MSLLDLSQELVLHILSYLHYVDLHTCRRVSRCFDRLIKSSTQLQYSMQLQLSGYQDNPYSPLVIAEKYKLLRQQEFAWSCLDFDKEASVRIPFSPSGIYDLTDGVLLLGESVSGNQSGADTLRWTTLPALLSASAPQHCWESIDVGAHIVDVGLAVQEHDLIAVATDRETENKHIAFEIRLIQLSTGLAHPLASKSIIPLATWHSNVVLNQSSICLEIIGDLLCFLFHYPTPSPPAASFQVYNWKSGKHLQSREINCPNFATFVFLTPDVVVLPNCADNTIELCRVGDIPEDPSTPVQVPTACVLQLPRLGRGHSISQITCRSDPKMTKTTRHAPAFASNEPFYISPENAIVIFNVMTHDTQGFHECLTLIVHTAALLAILQSPPVPISDGPSEHNALLLSGVPESSNEPRLELLPGSPPQLPWMQWGPRTCRWLETSFNASRWITTTCGQRYATVEEDDMEDGTTRSTIVVYDFNPHTVRRLAALHRRKRRRLRGRWDVSLPDGEVVPGSLSPPGPLGSGDATLIPFTDPHTRVIGQIQCEASELQAGYVIEYRTFEQPVRTSLPYAQMSTYDTFAYGAVLLDRNFVIGVKLDDVDQIKELAIHSVRTGRS
ncbi:hypothetical protein C8Q80DRAFT_1144245 [Daedaleopsis nitida]|nr:hypothetical protein C8Q80DRAFT_1144245 [Daedaleopsis nitida]